MGTSRVYLVRHAKAEKEQSRGDAARRLTSEGRDAFAALARRLGNALALTRIVSSPFVRAVETARVLSGVTGAPVEEDDALASGRSSGDEILELARGAGHGVALVGHNPEIQEAIARVAGKDEAVRPGCIAALEVGDAGVRILWIAAPEAAAS